ncbi:PorP/SprF family type IX secretion system membrane protein [Pelobium manganitolerans]|nr:type IX secretion system membrane protein PorP/SprF [Pelobium manganitolerans]
MTYYVWLLMFFTIQAAYAQQKPQYSQYILNNYITNPALSGIEGYIDVKAATRRQWVGIEGAPKTSYLTVHMPIGNTSDWADPTSGGMVGDNPLGKSYRSDYTASSPHHGVGLSLVKDEAGALGTNTVNLTYAYHLGLAPKLNLAVGIGAGASQFTPDASKIKTEVGGDPAIAEKGKISSIKPELNAGVWLYAAAYFAGVSVQQLLPQEIAFSESGSSKGKTVPHFFATAGFRVWLGDNFTVIPSVMLKYVKPAPPATDFSAKFTFRDKAWLGASYRKDDSWSAMLGFNIGSLLNISYAYDFVTSDIKTAGKASHEIVLGLMLNNRYKVTCPKNF